MVLKITRPRGGFWMASLWLVDKRGTRRPFRSDSRWRMAAESGMSIPIPTPCAHNTASPNGKTHPIRILTKISISARLVILPCRIGGQKLLVIAGVLGVPPRCARGRAAAKTVAKRRENTTLPLCHATHGHSQMPMEGVSQQSPAGFAVAPSRLALRGETRPSGGPPHPSRSSSPL